MDQVESNPARITEQADSKERAEHGASLDCGGSLDQGARRVVIDGSGYQSPPSDCPRRCKIGPEMVSIGSFIGDNTRHCW